MLNSYMTNEEILMEKITQIIETSADYRQCEEAYSNAQTQVFELLKQVSENPVSLIDRLDYTRADLINTVAKESYLCGLKDAILILTRTTDK